MIQPFTVKIDHHYMIALIKKAFHDASADPAAGACNQAYFFIGFHKLYQTRLHQDNTAIRGMIQKINHLVKVEEV